MAVKDSLYTAGRRGTGVTVIAEKIAGAAAAQGRPLAEVAGLCRRVNAQGRSMGIALTPTARGQGLGTLAQRMLSDYLLQSAHRVEASTDVDNHAEQHSLERAGFTREGVVRGAQYRADGLHHDLVMYARTRDTLAG